MIHADSHHLSRVSTKTEVRIQWRIKSPTIQQECLTQSNKLFVQNQELLPSFKVQIERKLYFIPIISINE